MRIRKENNELQQNDIELIAKVSDAFAHPVRIQLFKFIFSENLKGNEEVCNKLLVENFDYAQSTISQHIKKLLESELVISKSVKTSSYYFINLPVLHQYRECLKKLSINS